jgi:hypothetical protein
MASTAILILSRKSSPRKLKVYTLRIRPATKSVAGRAGGPQRLLAFDFEDFSAAIGPTL